MERVYPHEYFLQVEDNSKLLYLGIIILGIVACVAIVGMVVAKK